MRFSRAIPAIAAAVVTAGIVASISVQSAQTITTPFSTAIVVTSCGTAPYSSGQWPYTALTQAPLTEDVNGNLCTGATFSGTITVGTVAQGAKGTDAAADSWYVQPGTGAVFPISATSLPLPALAATSTLQTTGNTALTTINTTLGSPMQQTGGTVAVTTSDPCTSAAKTNVAIATSSGNTQLVAGSASKKVYVCSYHVLAATAAVVSLIEGTGAACTTANEAAVWGSTTAASGESYAANGGMAYGNGAGTVGVTATAANGICLLQSGTAALAGNLTYVQQ